MDEKLLITELQLGYAPMSAYFFSNISKAQEFRKSVSDSHLYIIAQRNEITFNNFKRNGENIYFEINQAGNSDSISCIMPIFQENITLDKTKTIASKLYDRRQRFILNKSVPNFGTQSFSILEINPETFEEQKLIWFSPEKLFQNHWKGFIKAKFSKDYEIFLKYNVHYVGKSTEQNICKRLSNHSTFQEILSTKDALTYGNIPSDEIVVLLLKIEENLSIVNWGNDSSGDEMANYIMNYRLPTIKKLSLDAEKILIQNFQPDFNKVLYKSYPNQDDIVNKDFHKTILYGLKDPIILGYNNGDLRGNSDFFERDYLSVQNINREK